MSDWEEVKARLGMARSIGEQDDDLSVYVKVADIRAALEEVEEWRETARSEMAGRRAAEEEVEAVTQTSGDLCDSCGWRTVIAGRCVKCAAEKAEAELASAVDLLRIAREEVERLRSSIASYQAAAHNYVNEHAEVARLKRAENRLRNALEQIDRETRSASDVGLLRMGSIARAALRGGK